MPATPTDSAHDRRGLLDLAQMLTDVAEGWEPLGLAARGGKAYAAPAPVVGVA